MHVGLIGYGYWGTNLLRNLIESSYVSRISVCDLKKERLLQAQKIQPDIFVTDNYKDLILNKEIEAIVIATPVSSHYELAYAALSNQKHVVVEKPLCTSSILAKKLISIAQLNHLVLLVDHTFLYNGAVRLIKDKIDSGTVGQLKYIDSTRINLGVYQDDTNVIWDLASHDISIILLLIKEKPTHIRTIGQHNPKYNKDDIAYIFLYYESGLLVQINCSWASPVKIREMIIGGESQMIIYDDIEPTDKVKIYDFEQVGVNEEYKKQALIDYRLGDLTIPKFSTKEPLKKMLENFFYCILHQTKPFSSAEKALDIIVILEKAEQSLRNQGELIEL